MYTHRLVAGAPCSVLHLHTAVSDEMKLLQVFALSLALRSGNQCLSGSFQWFGSRFVECHGFVSSLCAPG
ncbi:hypothetical protein J3E68DRAFT_412532 [Trichoderma sp. SZMC 28012]